MSALGKLGRGLGSLGDKLTMRTASLRRGGKDSAAGGAAAADGTTPAAASPAPHPGSGVLLGVQPSEDEVEAALAELAPGYFQPPAQFDALEFELRQLPVDFDQRQLENVAEERTGVLEVRARWVERAAARCGCCREAAGMM